jgi:periplasmic copper chaperone A
MLFGIDPAAKPGTTTLLTLTFGDGRRIYRKAYIVGAGEAKPD